MAQLLGKPIPISDLPAKRAHGTDWLPIFQQVPEGFAQVIDANYGTIQTAINRLVDKGKINEHEFGVRIRKDGKKVTVFLVHETAKRRSAKVTESSG